MYLIACNKLFLDLQEMPIVNSTTKLEINIYIHNCRQLLNINLLALNVSKLNLVKGKIRLGNTL